MRTSIRLAILLSIGLLGACGGGGGGGDESSSSSSSGTTSNPPPQAPAPQVTLSANQTTIRAGESLILTWTTQNATSCTASGGWTGSKVTSGSETLTPQDSTAFALSCTGAGGSTNQSVSVTVTPVADGVVSYNSFGITSGVTPAEYQVFFRLSAFNATSRDPAQLASLVERAYTLAAPGGSATLGTQTATLDQLACDPLPSASTPYAAVGLFDRSGSMRDNDPAGDTLAAAREFVNRMGAGDTGMIAAFPGGYGGRPGGSVVTFLNANFTSDKATLLNAINAVGPPDGDTPLWHSADLSLDRFALTSASNKALLVFSDGEDTERPAVTNSTAVTRKALAGGIRVFSVNLRNSNSFELDSIALATGGSVFSTTEARRLVAFYGTLGQLLGNRAVTCSASLTVRFTPVAGVGEVGYGPASNTNITLTFNGTSAAGDVRVPLEFNQPLYPGRKRGTHTSGASVYETDLYQQTNLNQCIVTVAGGLRNGCTSPLFFSACNTGNPTDCRRAVLMPNAQIAVPFAATVAVCPTKNAPSLGLFNYFVAMEASGASPAEVYNDWTPPESYLCVAAKGAVPQIIQ